MANVSSSNGLEKRPKLRFPGFDEPWNESKLSACFAKNIKKNTDGRISNVICNSAKMGLSPSAITSIKTLQTAITPAGIT